MYVTYIHQHLYAWFWKPTGVGQACGHPQRICPSNSGTIAFLGLTTNSSFSHLFLPPSVLDWWYDNIESQCRNVGFLTASQRFPLCKFSNTDPFTLGLWACPIVGIIIWWVYYYWARSLLGHSNMVLELNDIFMIFYETLTSQSIRFMDYKLCRAFSVSWVHTEK